MQSLDNNEMLSNPFRTKLGTSRGLDLLSSVCINKCIANITTKNFEFIGRSDQIDQLHTGERFNS
jgi:hypothetical protein